MRRPLADIRHLLLSLYLSDGIIWELHRRANTAAATLMEFRGLLFPVTPTCSSVAPTRASCIHTQMFPTEISL